MCRECSASNLVAIAALPANREKALAANAEKAKTPEQRRINSERARAMNASRTTDDRRRAAAKISPEAIVRRSEKIRESFRKKAS
jgi:hypothetical protein